MQPRDESSSTRGVQIGHLSDVGAADECSVTRPGQHDAAQRIVRLQALAHRHELQDQRRVEGVDPRLMVDRDSGKLTARGELFKLAPDLRGDGRRHILSEMGDGADPRVGADRTRRVTRPS
jgi:hypothetical protein